MSSQSGNLYLYKNSPLKRLKSLFGFEYFQETNFPKVAGSELGKPRVVEMLNKIADSLHA
jgi:hypothetical protein